MLAAFFVIGFLGPPTSDLVIADFEQKDYGKWTVTGSAFGSGPAQGTLPNQMPVFGFGGRGLVDSYNGGDASTGTLTSPAFTIQRPFVNFLLGGGYHPRQTCITLIVDGKIVRSTTGRSKTPQDTEALTTTSWDVQNYLGKKASIQILDLASGGWGHINVDDIAQSDHATGPIDTTVTNDKPYTPPKPEPLYREKYRPQFHFSSQKNWLNDPNGLVYFDGEYHLFFQHNPDGIQWGNMTWGHAVSPDLVHWKQLPHAIRPDDLGTIFSGSAAIDHGNTAGFGKDAMVAMYTAAGKPFTQCLAASTDKGRTWTKYEGNPVIGHIVHENRDPRIFWHKPSHQWVMALYLDGDEFAIFGSPNLKAWKELSRLHIPDSSECPDIFELPIGNQTKWIFLAANFHYYVGSFDGVRFLIEEGPYSGEYGGNFYASQTYNDTPDGRRIQIGWMNGPGPFPNMPFNQQMSFPCELRLVETHEGMRLARTPVKEIERLTRKSVLREDFEVAAPIRIKVSGGLYDIRIRLHPSEGSRFVLRAAGQDIVVDCATMTVMCLGKVGPFSMRDGELDLRVLVDRSSMEVFAQDGLLSMTSYLPAEFVDDGVSIRSENGGAQVHRLDVHELKSAW